MLAVLAVLAGGMGSSTVPRHAGVFCPSMWPPHPTFTLSHPPEDRFPGSPLTEPGWHFSRHGIAPCKVASLFQGSSISRTFPMPFPIPGPSPPSEATFFSPVAGPLALRRHAMLCLLLMGEAWPLAVPSSGNKNY